MSDLLDRQATLRHIEKTRQASYMMDDIRKASRIRRGMDLLEKVVMKQPSAQTETCDGCKHKGKWENEVENGYNSPCTICKRRVNDNYER